jgi:hypothetical protein
LDLRKHHDSTYGFTHNDVCREAWQQRIAGALEHKRTTPFKEMGGHMVFHFVPDGVCAVGFHRIGIDWFRVAEESK